MRRFSPWAAKVDEVGSMKYPNAAGRDVLIVEDEILIAAQLEELVVSLGCRPHLARELAQALELVSQKSFDAAFLDLNLSGETSLPVADMLWSQRTPFAFISGYEAQDVRDKYPGVLILPKPFTEDEIEQALRSLL
jgi:CheY-like chemotaxis protein